MQERQEEELANELQFCVHPGCQNNLIPTVLTAKKLELLHKDHIHLRPIKEFIEIHNEFQKKAGSQHSSDELPLLIESRVTQTQSTCKKSNLMFGPQYIDITVRQSFYNSITKGDVDTFQEKVSRDQYHCVPLIDDYSNAVKQMKVVINKAYDQIDEFIEKTLATANQAIENLTNVMDYQQQKECLVLKLEKPNQSIKEIESQGKNVVVIQQEQKQQIPEPIIEWSWKYRGRQCEVVNNQLRGLRFDGSNCFIQPLFGVNDTRTIKFRQLDSQANNKYQQIAIYQQLIDNYTSFQIFDSDIRMKAIEHQSLDSPVKTQQGTYSFKRKEFINKDREDSAVTNYPDGLFKYDGEWHNLELTYDGKQKTIQLQNTLTGLKFIQQVKFKPDAKLQFAVGIFSEQSIIEILS